MRTVALCVIISVLFFALPQGARAAQTKTNLDGAGNLEFNVANPSNPSASPTFKMNTDGAIQLPSGTAAVCDATRNVGAIRWNNTVTPGIFEGCDGVKWKPLGATEVFSGWPDAIKCTFSGGYTLVLIHDEIATTYPGIGNIHAYHTAGTGSADPIAIAFFSSTQTYTPGNWPSAAVWGAGDCGTSIPKIIAAGRAYYFAAPYPQ